MVCLSGVTSTGVDVVQDVLKGLVPVRLWEIEVVIHLFVIFVR